MILDDESLLSAYLDGELDPARRLAVENALCENPRLTERLQELAAVRALVGGLARPKLERDLAPAVLAALPARRRYIHALAPRVPWLSAATALAAAAAVLVAILPQFRSLAHPRHPRVGPVPPGVAAQPTTPAPDRIPSPAPVPAAPEVASVAPTVSTVTRDDDRQRLLMLLDQPDLPVVSVRLDRIDADSTAAVQALISETAPHVALQGEIQLNDSRLIDPLRPGAAVVYVVLLDGTELESLTAQLCRMYPGLVQMTPPLARDHAEMLASLGSVRLFEGPIIPDATRLRPPPADLPDTVALRGAAECPSQPDLDDEFPTDETQTTQPPPASASTRLCLIWLHADKNRGRCLSVGPSLAQ